MKTILFSIIFSIFFIGCSNNLDLPSDLTSQLNNIIKTLEDSDTLRLKAYCTNTGYKSILNWSDSLKNTKFTNQLIQNLKNNGQGVFSINWTDTTAYLSLGKSDNILGATNGYLILINQKNKFLIKEFRGGK